MNISPCFCELYNIISQIGDINFGHGLRVKQITEEHLNVLDRSYNRYIGRFQGFIPWFIEQEPQIDYSKHVDGDPAGAIRLFRIALVLFFGEKVKFGPIICMIETDNGLLGGVVNWDRYMERFPQCSPDEFSITSDNVEQLTALFNQLIKGFQAPLLKIPIDRLMISKSIYSDTIIDQSIALEALYLSNDYNRKGKLLAQRGATFVGRSDADREEIYINLNSFYKARSEILHQGEEHPVIHLKTCTLKDCVALQDWCFKYLRETIRKLLANDKYFTMDKRSFVSELKNAATQWASKFDCIYKREFNH